MSMRKRSSAGSGLALSNINEDEPADLNDDAQDLMKDNLELMKDVVMRIREDPDFAKSIYANCPRLQHLLEKRPDLRPIFEDPNLVRINFEQVYRDAGGKLPEDEEEKEDKVKLMKKILAKIVNHPLFKVVKFVLLIKKVVGCVTGGGIAMVRSIGQGFCCTSPPSDIPVEDLLEDDEENNVNPKNAANQEALNQAAEHMESPEVQEQMQDLLNNDDPEALQEAIENDPELRALRDSNPLCAELMSDPETMKILVDPENLRALGECPDLIEQDFADPDWTPPEVEAEGLEDAADDADIEADVQPEEEEEPPLEEELALAEEEEAALHEEYELGEAEDSEQQQGANKAKAAKQQRGQQKTSEGQDRARGFLGQVGGGFTNLVAAQLVGGTLGDFIPADDGLPDVEDPVVPDVEDPGLEDAAEQGATAGDAAAANVAAASAAAGMLGVPTDEAALEDLDKLEDGVDKLEEATEDQDRGTGDDEARSHTGAVVAGGVGGAIVAGGTDRDQQPRGHEEEEEEEPEKKARFGWFGRVASDFAAATKEQVATTLFGDLGEVIIEEKEEEDKNKENHRETDQTSRSTRDFFGRKKTFQSEEIEL